MVADFAGMADMDLEAAVENVNAEVFETGLAAAAEYAEEVVEVAEIVNLVLSNPDHEVIM